MGHYPTLQHRWFDEVWNQGLVESIDELLHPDVVGHGLVDKDGNEITGIEAFKAFYHSFRSAFPDIRIEVEATVSEGDMVVARCLVTATHAGEGFLCAPTNATVSFTGTCWARLVDGRIAESWNHFDFATLMAQVQAAAV